MRLATGNWRLAGLHVLSGQYFVQNKKPNFPWNQDFN
jgi:hypothetical protein